MRRRIIKAYRQEDTEHMRMQRLRYMMQTAESLCMITDSAPMHPHFLCRCRREAHTISW